MIIVLGRKRPVDLRCASVAGSEWPGNEESYG
jgi:hypothetical protein